MPNYHAEIDGWHSEIVGMADGRPPAIRWSNNKDGITIWYYDEDHNGQIDYRHEIQSHFVIHSYDDNGDGVFDRETYWKTESEYPWDGTTERRIAVAVPKTKDDEP